jgi:hypothetical protein
MEYQSGWYAVRSVIRLNSTETESSRPYEERITLWKAKSFEEAIDRAEAETIEYAEGLGEYVVEFGQSYALVDEPGDGTEIFSLLRDSDLEPRPYVATYFATGAERQH